MALIRTKAVLDALKTTLEAMAFPSGHAFEGQNFFQSVRLYPVEQLTQAIQDLLEFNDRLCLCIPVGDKIDTQQAGSKLTTIKHGEFTLVLADKDYVPGKPAVFGDGSTYPGLIEMKDDVIVALTGETLGIRNAVVRPFGGESYRFQKSEQDTDQGREGYVMHLDISMGKMEKQLNRGSTIYR